MLNHQALESKKGGPPRRGAPTRRPSRKGEETPPCDSGLAELVKSIPRGKSRRRTAYIDRDVSPDRSRRAIRAAGERGFHGSAS